MRKILSLFLLIASIPVFAEPANISYSAPFDEPDALDCKVVQMKNGNTFLFGFTEDDGIEVTLFDGAHKKISNQTLTGNGLWKPGSMVPGMLSGLSKGSKICGILSNDDEAVVFLEQVNSRVPALIRIELSATDGKLIKQEKIAEMPEYPKGAGYAVVFGGVEMKTFYVEQDPATGSYAVAAFDGFAHETKERLEVSHYDSHHKLLGRRFYDAPEVAYKYINYLGMVVEGDNAVHIATYCFGGNTKTGSAAKVVVSRLGAGNLEHHPLDFTRNLKNADGCMVYNPVTKQIMLLTLTAERTEQKMFSNTKNTLLSELLISIDPQTYQIAYTKSPSMQMAKKYYKSHYEEDGELRGTPMNLVVNADGSVTVVVEDNVAVYRQSGNMGSHLDYSELNAMSITDYKDGEETSGYVIRKAQRVDNAAIPNFAQQDYRKNRLSFAFGGWIRASAIAGFYSFDYLSTSKGRFIIFNDHPENFERDAKKSPKRLVGVSDANTALYRLTDGEMSRSYLFGTPGEAFDNRFAMISSGNYSEATNEYAVLMIEKNGKKKQAKMAWVHLN